MKTITTIIILLITANSYAQTFQELTTSSFYGVYRGSVAFTDIDNDNDQDLLIAGGSISLTGRLAHVYSNDGNGLFNEVIGAPFNGVINCSIDFADIDGDNDQDLLITGENTSGIYISNLFLNDGNGNFSFFPSLLDSVSYSEVTFADIDNDNDQDLLISGLNNNSQVIYKLYKNDGIGNFSLITGTPFTGMLFGSVAFADVNGDNYPDVFITGSDSSKIYINDSTGYFTELLGTSISGASYDSKIAFADIDNDNDQDLLITGKNGGGIFICELYKNDGNGFFSLTTGTPFVGINNGAVAFADVDNDNDLDLLITGETDSIIKTAKMYINDGIGNFTLLANTPFEGVQHSSVTFADIDNDNDKDVLITGYGTSGLFIAKLYENICSPSTNIDVQVACDSYTWNNGITYTANNNTAIDSLSSIGGCDSIVTLNLTINSVNNAVINNSPTLMAVDSFSTYQWLNCDSGYVQILGETSQNFTASSNGNYAVIISSNSCSDTSMCEAVLNVSLLENVVSMYLYPNPSNGEFILKTSNTINGKIQVTNYIGKVVNETMINGNYILINLKNNNKGLYFIKLIDSNNNLINIKKIIIQ